MAKEEKNTKNAPVFKARRGNVEATVWNNTLKGKDGEFTVHTLSVHKNYQDKDKKWQQSNSFNRTESMLLMLALNDAVEFMTAPKVVVESDDDDEDDD